MSWGPVHGHDDVLASFRRVNARGRLAHAYLFVGPEGIGKKLFAVTLAQSLLCRAARVHLDAPCGQCADCLQLAGGVHPDFQLAEPPPDAHEFPVDLIQELIRKLAFKPVRGRRRIAVVDQADLFNPAAANCFLKTLEEPPPDALLILISESSDHQFATITSRCQIIRFAPLALEIAANLLQNDGVVPPTADARRIVTLAKGNLALAKVLADDDVRQLRSEMLKLLGQPMVDGVALASRINAWTEDTKDSAEKRRRAGLGIGFIVEVLRGALASGAGHAGVALEGEDLATSRAVAHRVPEERLLRALERCLDADRQVERRLQLVLVTEALGDALTPLLSN